MGLITLFKNLKQLANQRGLPYQTWINDWFYSIGDRQDIDYYKSWIYACIQKRAQAFAAIEFRLFQARGNEVIELEEHELLNLLYRINYETTKYDFLEMTSIYLDIFGSSPWIIFRNKKTKKPEQMFLARPDLLKIKRDANGYIVNYQYDTGTVKIDIDKNDVILLRNPDPRDPIKGLSMISVVKTTADISEMAKLWNFNLLQRDARPSGIITDKEGRLSEDEAKKLIKSLDRQHSGYDNVYKHLFLGGGLSFEKLTLPPKDLELLEGMKMAEREILAVFGVPKSILGLEENSNRATVMQDEINFEKYTNRPRMIKITEQLNEFFVPQFGEDLWLDFKPSIREDIELKLKEWTAGNDNWLTVNEIRAEQGKPEVEGGDYILKPLNMVPQMSAVKSNQTKDAKFVKMKVKKENKDKVNLNKQKEIIKRIKIRNYKKNKIAEDIGTILSKKIFNEDKVKFRIINSQSEKPEKKKFGLKERLTPEFISSYFEKRFKEELEIEKLWIAEFKKLFKKQKKAALDKLAKKKSSLAEKIFDKDKEIKATIEIISPLLYQSLVTGARSSAELLGEEVTPIFDRPRLRKWLKNRAKYSSKAITETTLDKLEKTLKEGLAAGEGLYELSNRVAEIFDQAGETRAMLIARTEVTEAVIAAHCEYYKELGFEYGEWLLSPNACDICIELAGSKDKWTFDEFHSLVTAETHPNCQCDIVPLE